MNQKGNLGFQRTHENIRNCVYELLQEKAISQITVGEICKKIGINRSTFYAHYQDVYAVMELIFEELNQELVARYEGMEQDNPENQEIEGTLFYTRQRYIKIQMEHMKEYRWFYLGLLRDPANLLMEKAMKALREEIADPIFYRYGVQSKEGDYFFRYTIAGYFAVCQQWLENGCKETPEHIATIMERLQPMIPDIN